MTGKAAARILPRLSLYAPLRRARRSEEAPPLLLLDAGGGRATTTTTTTTAFASSEKRRRERESTLLRVVESLRRVNSEHHRSEEENVATSSSSLSSLFAGVEASLDDLGEDGVERMESAELIREHGLEIIANIDVRCCGVDVDGNPSSSWELVKSFESQLDAISDLGTAVAHVNCRTRFGTKKEDHRPTTRDDEYDDDQDAALILDYLLEVLPLSAQFLEERPHVGRGGNEIDVMGGSPHHLIGISHETYSNSGGNVLRSLDTVRHLLEVVPPLRLAVDPSTWHRDDDDDDDDDHDASSSRDAWGIRRADDGEEGGGEAGAMLSAEIVPHVDLIRSGTSSLLRNGTAVGGRDDDRFEAHHRFLWEEVWARKADRGVERVLMTLHDDGCAIADGTHNAGAQDSRMKRLENSALSIHQYYDEWSMSRFR